MGLLDTDNIMGVDEMIESVRNGKTTLKSTGTRRIEGETTNVVGENTGKRKRGGGKGRGRKGRRRVGKERVRGSGGLSQRRGRLREARHYDGVEFAGGESDMG